MSFLGLTLHADRCATVTKGTSCTCGADRDSAVAGWQARAERAEAQLVACRREYDELWATERERDLAVRDLAVKLERAREALERIAQVWPEGGYAATWMRDTASEALSRLDGPEKLAPTNRGEQQ